MDKEAIERVSRRLNAKRREMIAQPLSSCWDDLAQDAIAECMAILGEPSMEMLGAAFEAMFVDKWDCTQAPMVGAGWDAALSASPLSQGGEEGERAIRALQTKDQSHGT